LKSADVSIVVSSKLNAAAAHSAGTHVVPGIARLGWGHVARGSGAASSLWRGLSSGSIFAVDEDFWCVLSWLKRSDRVRTWSRVAIFLELKSLASISIGWTIDRSQFGISCVVFESTSLVLTWIWQPIWSLLVQVVRLGDPGINHLCFGDSITSLMIIRSGSWIGVDLTLGDPLALTHGDVP
jgi:hypothetical protein